MTRWELDEAIYDLIGKVDNDEADAEDLEFLEYLKDDLINMFKEREERRTVGMRVANWN